MSAAALQHHGLVSPLQQPVPESTNSTANDDEEFIRRIQERYNQTKDLLNKI